jgi:O-antigen ligase
VLFFLPMYGLLIPLIPVALWMGRRRRFWGLGLAFLFLFLLGLGDTTPLPRLFFGSGWAWLTYDRFSFWASLLLLVFFGEMMVRECQRLHLPQISKNVEFRGGGVRGVSLAFLVPMTFIALLIALVPTWLPTQPPQLDMRPIVDFLARGDHAQYRYLTFGFGDQLAYLSRLTETTTIDGSYHTARTLPELRASGIGQDDTAFWLPDGLAKLDPILQKSGERGVRWGFVNLRFYNPVLFRNGWQFVTTLSNGVTVWENPRAMLPPPVQPPDEPPFTAFAWGTFPILAFFTSGALALRRYRPALSERVLSGVQFIATGLLPFGLTFWVYRRLFAFPHERIYFAYSDALFFLSDGLALVAVLAWTIQKIPNLNVRDTNEQISKNVFAPLTNWCHVRLKDFFWQERTWLFALCALASLSVFWSLDWHTSFYIALHLWLAFCLYLSLRDTPGMWRPFAIGSVAALVFQAIVGIWQFISQSTTFTMALGLDWPGNLVPAMSGASVVQLAEGTRILRAYGTFPHPNLLGGWIMTSLAALLTLILIPSKGRAPALTLFAAGLVLLVLTFSRSAWLGFATLSAVILFHWKQFERKALFDVLAVGLICLIALAFPLQNLFATRLTNSQVKTEQVSNFTRLWLIQRTWELIQQKPLLGVGIGSYTLALSRHVADFYDIEPVHNIPLLVWSELGLGGLVALAGLSISVGVGAIKARSLLAIVFLAALVGLFVISLFDHYLWTLAPGRLLFTSVLGLWAGQAGNERNC